MTSGSPIPFTAFTDENIHAQAFLDSQFEFIQPAGIGSFVHFAQGGILDKDIPRYP
jgi:bifunctional N-acetylglucosamine-1-phosphate-uridyltransferase/glucosamine-1-phosphate-acetyltransferase GlmU-like protein